MVDISRIMYRAYLYSNIQMFFLEWMSAIE